MMLSKLANNIHYKEGGAVPYTRRYTPTPYSTQYEIHIGLVTQNTEMAGPHRNEIKTQPTPRRLNHHHSKHTTTQDKKESHSPHRIHTINSILLPHQSIQRSTCIYTPLHRPTTNYKAPTTTLGAALVYYLPNTQKHPHSRKASKKI
ncbi:hypothetical protein BJ508DRAFT_175265 [Ascobolus immersus RN42]|uniref:Uncharacterized protein n=1 Tax=Ascobolus immersus RN42 TaxID=1160509 RepID=A0A3N4HTE5_ASCIM|nr:hypothetical protein BJ508DRAFT_175265 [Ascobolus immersus RN42]